jgi:hypothetical protein
MEPTSPKNYRSNVLISITLLLQLLKVDARVSA